MARVQMRESLDSIKNIVEIKENIFSRISTELSNDIHVSSMSVRMTQLLSSAMLLNHLRGGSINAEHDPVSQD